MTALVQSWERCAEANFMIVPLKRRYQTSVDVTLRGDGEPAYTIRLEFGPLWI